MKAVRIVEPFKVECIDVEKPTPKAGEALLKIEAAGICGSDIGAFRGTNNLVSYPRIIGHELAGVVMSIPEDNPKGIKVGDKVVVEPYVYCGHCYPCRIGRTNCCTDMHTLGVHIDGGMCEYFCHPAHMLVKMPEGMTFEQAAMAEPLTISMHGIHRGAFKAGEYCVVIGAGPIGLAAAMGAQAYGGHAILFDIVQERLDFAKNVTGIEYVINSGKEDAT
ncbi:MAG: alcohol dehydrogenase catalytic domain-containing protein, partial [Synergistaceae bacterium]|nr:alcohol dehydrogenase catalytic domain-containing protein [Synergistaceae bacterium]